MNRPTTPTLNGLALAALLLAGGTPPALAAGPTALAVANPGFEDQATPPGAFLVGLPSGWQAWDPTGRIDGNQDALGRIRPLPGTEYFPAGTPEGDQAALVFLSGDEGGEAGLQQTLADTLQPFTHYTLRVAVGNIASGTSLPGSADGGGLFYNLAGFPGYRIELRAGDVLVAADTNSLAIPEGTFRHAVLNVDTGASHAALGQALQIRLVNLATPGTPQAPGIEVDFDDVQLLASPVPEPAAAALWAVAGVLALARRRCARHTPSNPANRFPTPRQELS